MKTIMKIRGPETNGFTLAIPVEFFRTPSKCMIKFNRNEISDQVWQGRVALLKVGDYFTYDGFWRITVTDLCGGIMTIEARNPHLETERA